MTQRMEWRRSEAEARIREVLDAARLRGPQILLEDEGSYEIRFVPRKQSLDDLFAQPGTFPDDLDI